jgi:hypothetical protein
MSTLNIPPLIVLVPVLILGALSGFRRGWKDEAWTLGALLMAVFISARPDSVLLPVLERVINAFQRAGQALLGRSTDGPGFHFEGVTRPWAAVLAFLVFAALAYAFGHLIGKGEAAKGIWKLLAGLIGALNLPIVVTWLITRFVTTRQEDGSVQFVIPSFKGAAVIFGTPTTNNVLASWPGLIGLLLVVILLVFILTRTGRVWR